MEVLEEKEEKETNVVYLQLFIPCNLMYFQMRKLINYMQLIWILVNLLVPIIGHITYCVNLIL